MQYCFFSISANINTPKKINAILEHYTANLTPWISPKSISETPRGLWSTIVEHPSTSSKPFLDLWAHKCNGLLAILLAS